MTRNAYSCCRRSSRNWGQWKDIVLLENTKPILCDKILYYVDLAFTSRIMLPTVMPPRDLDLFVAKSQNWIRPLQDSDVQADGLALSDVPPEHLLLMEAGIELSPLDDEEGAFDILPGRKAGDSYGA